MRKRHISLIVVGLSLISVAVPDALLNLIEAKTGSAPRPPVESLDQRQANFAAGLNSHGQANYLEETKAAITRQLQETGRRDFVVSKIVFTSEKTKWVAGQKQIQLSFTYQVQYPNARPQKQRASLLLAADGAGKMFAVL